MDTRTLGVLGGGQLGRMMGEAALRLGVRMAIVDPMGSAAPAGAVATGGAVEGKFTDEEKIRELAKISDVLTVEIEHVDADVLEALESEGVAIQPSPRTIRMIQDKLNQKLHLQAHGIPLPDFMDLPNVEAALEAGVKFGYPYMLKTRKLAYDGRGNCVVNSAEEVPAAFEKLGQSELYCERWCPFTKELAVMVVRSETELKMFPVVETTQKDSICHTVFAPAQISMAASTAALDMCSKAISSFDGYGIYGVEMFLLEDDTVLLNEIAPRPHNSGHYTMEACANDQFELHIRAVLGLPLASCEMVVGAAVMLNILGEDTMEATKEPLEKSLTIPNAGIHWYGKAAARKGRKMAHVTFVGPSMRALRASLAPLGIEGLAGTSSDAPPQVGIIMGSDSDLPTMKAAADVMLEFDIPFEITIVSAHRTPARMYSYAAEAADRGIKVIIAGAGGAAHLPGMVAALTPLPVIGVPVKSSTMSGTDSLYSIVQMPRGIPVATVAIGNAMNAGLLAVRMLGAGDPRMLEKMQQYMNHQEATVLTKAERMEENLRGADSEAIGSYIKEIGF